MEEKRGILGRKDKSKGIRLSWGQTRVKTIGMEDEDEVVEDIEDLLDKNEENEIEEDSQNSQPPARYSFVSSSLKAPIEPQKSSKLDVEYKAKDNYAFPSNNQNKQAAFLERVKNLGQSFNNTSKGLSEVSLPNSKTKQIPSSSFAADRESRRGPRRSHEANSSYTDEFKNSFQDMLKKSTENSMQKQKAITSKMDYERMVMSGVKVQEPLKDEKKQKLISDFEFHFKPKFQIEDSPKKDSPIIEQSEVKKPKLDVEQPKQELNKPRNRSSIDILSFLNISSEHDSQESHIKPQEEDNSNLKRSSPFEEVEEEPVKEEPNKLMLDIEEPVASQKSEEKPDENQGPPIEQKKSDTALSRLNFEHEKRARKSYFPEKLLRKVKDINDKPDRQSQSPQNPLFNQFFDMMPAPLGSTRLSDVFSRLSDKVEDSTIMPVGETEAHAILAQVRQTIKEVDIESIRDFSEALQAEQEANREIIQQKQQVEDFDEVLREMVKHRALISLDQISKLQLLNKVEKEVNSKIEEIERDIEAVQKLDIHSFTQNNGAWTEKKFLEKLCQDLGFHTLKFEISGSSPSLMNITFSIQSKLYFSLNFTQSGNDDWSYLLKNGVCRCPPCILRDTSTCPNPLNQPPNIVSIFNRVLQTSSSPNKTDAHFLLAYISKFYTRLNAIRKNMDFCISKYKISDIVLDSNSVLLRFVLFPKISKLPCTAKVTLGILNLQEPDFQVEFLSSNLRKRNPKAEIFNQLEQNFEEIVKELNVNDENWLLHAMDNLSKIMNEN